MGLVILAYGVNEWRQLRQPSEAEIMQIVEIRYLQELIKLKQTYGPDYTEDAEWTAKRLQAIRNEVTGPVQRKRERAASIMFAGGALLFLTASMMVSAWLFKRFDPGNKPQLKA
ncbi:MAG: hypothetical protein ACRETN_11275 [Nevskiales bacterium]